ncbi:tannase and feruloyl esterase domain-containing protein [Sarocladium implicatum]|nr:tannase and feruloyl esterase domain-containing protein [Sarocladium implicatum]
MFLWEVVLTTVLLANLAASRELDCKSLSKKIDFGAFDATCINSTYHGIGDFSLDGPTGVISNEVAFQEIHAAVAYAKGAQLVFSVWLPHNSSYEGRFLAVGNGGYGGTIDRVAMVQRLNEDLGFVIAGGDAGHDAWAETNGTDTGRPGLYVPFLNHEERVKAWIHNAISIFTPLAKAITKAAYGCKPRYAYFNGCSAGGGQAFALAQYHPDMYDGIVAGSPGNFQSHLWMSILWTFQAQQGDGALSAEVLGFVTAAVLDQCDDLDGVMDGVVENPLACPFDVAKLACKDGQEPTAGSGDVQCLTEGQIKSFKAVYAGPETTDTGESIFPGFSVGTETNWIIPVTVGLANGFSVPILQNLIYKDLHWDPSSFGYNSSDVAYLDERGGKLTNAISGDLSDFRSRGGKILSTMGWADPAITPLAAIEHRQRLVNGSRSSESVDEFYRLFMVPGGGHCSAAHLPQTPGQWHVMEPIIKWVEQGDGPDSILATDPADGSQRTRRLCPWPATAALVGDDEDDWESFECQVQG